MLLKCLQKNFERKNKNDNVIQVDIETWENSDVVGRSLKVGSDLTSGSKLLQAQYTATPKMQSLIVMTPLELPLLSWSD